MQICLVCYHHSTSDEGNFHIELRAQAQWRMDSSISLFFERFQELNFTKFNVQPSNSSAPSFEEPRTNSISWAFSAKKVQFGTNWPQIVHSGLSCEAFINSRGEKSPCLGSPEASISPDVDFLWLHVLPLEKKVLMGEFFRYSFLRHQKLPDIHAGVLISRNPVFAG